MIFAARSTTKTLPWSSGPRSAAERFSEYSERRTADAECAQKAVPAIADNIPLGQPILVGHHSERRARRDAQRIEGGLRRAVKCGIPRPTGLTAQPEPSATRSTGSGQTFAPVASRLSRPTSASRSAPSQNRPGTRKAWAVEGLTDGQAQQIANFNHLSFSFPIASYPASTYDGSRSLRSALDSKVIDADKTAQLAVSAHARIIAHCSRWVAHYENRAAYERAMLAEDCGTLADQNKPEKGGACRCWASPREGWSYIQKVNRVTVSVLHNYSDGGQPFSITIPLDKLTGIMSAAAVEQKRSAGLVIESSRGTGFYLAPTPTKPGEPTDAEETDLAPEPEAPAADQEAEPVTASPCAACSRPWPAHATHPATPCGYYWSADEWAREQARVKSPCMGDQIEAMRQTLKTGVAVVSAPQLFPTPAPLAVRMVELADIQPGQEVLEPSAGTGVLCKAITALVPSAKVFAVEVNHQLCELLSQTKNRPEDAAEGICKMVLQGDFLECFGLGRFDRIVMNPPFADGADIQHITHALRLLRPGGRIVALCASGHAKPRSCAR